MPLSPEEEKELAALESEFEPQELSSEEEAELAELEQEFSPKQSSVPKKDKLSKLQSGLAGLKQGASFGWYDEGLAAANTALDKSIDFMLRPFMDEDVEKFLDNPTFKQAYKQERDKIREEFDNLRQANPKTFLAGEVAGGAATSLLPGSAAAKAAGNLAKVVKGISGAAGVGAVSGAGLSEEEEIKEIAKDAAVGGTIGAVFGGTLLGAGKLASGIKNLSNNMQLKALGVGSKLSPKQQQEIVKFARDNKVLTSSPEKTLNNATELRQKAMDGLVGIKSKLKEENIDFIDKSALLGKFEEVIKRADNPDTKSAAKLARQIRQAVHKAKSDDIDGIQELYSRVGKHTRDSTKSPFERDTARALYAVMSDNVDTALIKAGETISNPGLKNAYRSANQEFRMANKIAEAAEREAGQMSRGTFLSPSDYFQAAIGGPVRAAAHVAGREASKKLGPATVAGIHRRVAPTAQTVSKIVKGMSKTNTKQGSTVGLLDLLRDKD
jgi:hypothetical protein